MAVIRGCPTPAPRLAGAAAGHRARRRRSHGGQAVGRHAVGSARPARPGSVRGALTVVDGLVVRAGADRAGPGRGQGPNCARLDVVPADGRAAAAEVAEHGADVWIPDDAAWAGTQGMAQLAPASTAGSGTVLATSPFYLVTDPATAGAGDGRGRRLAGPGPAARPPGRDPAGHARAARPRRVGRRHAGRGRGRRGGLDRRRHGRLGRERWLRVMPVTRTVAGAEPALPRSPGEVGVVPEHALLPRAARRRAGRRVPRCSRPPTTPRLLRYSWLPTAAAVADPATAGPLGRLLDTLTGAAGHPGAGRGRAAPAGRRRPARGPGAAAAGGHRAAVRGAGAAPRGPRLRHLVPGRPAGRRPGRGGRVRIDERPRCPARTGG